MEKRLAVTAPRGIASTHAGNGRERLPGDHHGRVSALPLFLALALVLSSCSSLATRYLGYRLDPRTPPKEFNLSLPAFSKGAGAQVSLDRHGIPTIVASDEYSLYFGFGYMEGRDRLFQLETLRRIASGTLREIVGNLTSNPDVDRMERMSRMVGLDRDARAILDSCDPADLLVFEAFADGVNAAAGRESLPMEFRLIGQRPEPWTPLDSCRIVALVSFGLAKDWEIELSRLELAVHQIGTGSTLERSLAIWKPVQDLPPHLVAPGDPGAPHMGANVAAIARLPVLAPELADWLRGLAISSIVTRSAPFTASPIGDGSFPELGAALAGLQESLLSGRSSSNNWALSSALTGSGGAAFASDPHMPHALPSLGYLVRLRLVSRMGSFSASGAGFAGIPAVTFGSNGKVAWGATSNWADVSDLYVEREAEGMPGHYLRDGRPVAFTEREEVFRIRRDDGGFDLERRTVRETVHGPVLGDFLERLPRGFPLVSLYRPFSPGKPMAAFRSLYRSSDCGEAGRALEDCSAFVGHWVLADASGEVAYAAPISLPLRSRLLGTFPAPGWLSAYDPEGLVPLSELPRILPGTKDFIATANNQVVDPAATPWPLDLEGDVPYRYLEIEGRLAGGLRGEAGGGGISKALGAVQTSGVDRSWPLVKQLLEEAFGVGTPSSTTEAEAREALLAWDGNHRPGSSAPTIFNALLSAVLRMTLEDETTGGNHSVLLSYFNNQPLLFGILLDPGNPAWDDRRTAAIETRSQVLRAAFGEAIDRLAKAYGPKVAGWRWETAAPFVLSNTFGSSPALAGYLNRSLPATGGINTPFKHQFSLGDGARFPVRDGPVLRIVVDFANPASSTMSLPGGESGRADSANYDDLLPSYAAGGGAPLFGED